MLIPAVAKKSELEALFAEHIYDDDMMLYNGYPYCNKAPDLTPVEDTFKWAIVNAHDEVVGYFTYHIDTHNDTVNWFGLYSFKSDTTIGLDVYAKLKQLLRDHRRVEWRMVGGNPVQPHYDRICKHFGGRKVVLKAAIKDAQGNYRDDYIYEIMGNRGGENNAYTD